MDRGKTSVHFTEIIILKARKALERKFTYGAVCQQRNVQPNWTEELPSFHYFHAFCCSFIKTNMTCFLIR